MNQRDWLLRLTLCFAVGGLGTAAIMCLFVGFGFSTAIGREAVYLYFLLQTLNVAAMRARERALLRSAQAPKPSRQMRIIRQGAAWLWRLGAVTLLGSVVLLLLNLLGVYSNYFWLQLCCWVGFFATLAGWLLRLMTFYRLRQSSIALAMEKERSK